MLQINFIYVRLLHGQCAVQYSTSIATNTIAARYIPELSSSFLLHTQTHKAVRRHTQDQLVTANERYNQCFSEAY